MKKITIKLLSIFTITLFTFSSCTKDRTCECSITRIDSRFEGVDQDNSQIEYEKVTKKWMKNSAKCVNSTETEDYVYSYPVLNQWNQEVWIDEQHTITTEYDCEIK